MSKYNITVNFANCAHWHWSLNGGADTMVMSGNTAEIDAPDGGTLTVKGVDANHTVLATDTSQLTDPADIVRVTGTARDYAAKVVSPNTFTTQAASNEEQFDETITWINGGSDQVIKGKTFTLETKWYYTNSVFTTVNSNLTLSGSGELSTNQGVNWVDIKVYLNGTLVYTQPTGTSSITGTYSLPPFTGQGTKVFHEL